jgi:hypothetical protein
MNENTKEKYVELFKALTDNQAILDRVALIFKNNELESLSEALSILKEIAIKENISELLLIIEDIKASVGQENLEASFFLSDINGVSIDTRLIEIDELFKIITNIGFNPHKDQFFNYEDNNYKKSKDLERLIRATFNTLTEAQKIKIESYYSSTRYESIDKYLKAIVSFAEAYIRDNNQYSEISYDVDPFASTQRVEFKNQIMYVTYNKLLLNKFAFTKNDEIINDYLEHFPDFYVFLDLVLCARFGADKKRAYSWFRAPSNWGKSFLFGGVLNKLGIVSDVTESEIKTAYSGSASSLNPEQFTNSWVLFIDEFKSAVSELKNITHSLSFSPKFRGKFRVPVYLKLCASAEIVKSLVNDGAMETQFQNRFLIWKEEGTQLSTRPIFKSNPANYLNVITAYTYKYLREQADEYIALGKIEAGNKANATLDIIYEKKQTITASKEDALFENLEQFKTIFEEGRFCLSPFYFKAPDGSIFITNKSKFASAFLNEYFDENEAKILNRHKDINIILGLGENPQRTTINLGGAIRKQGYLFIEKQVQSHVNNINTDGYNDFIFA